MTALSLPQIDDEKAETILGEITGADDSLERWNELGFITVDMFRWLFLGQDLVLGGKDFMKICFRWYSVK